MSIFTPSYGTLDTLDALQHARIYGSDAEYRDALAAHYAIVSPPAVTDDAAWHAVVSSGLVDIPDEPQPPTPGGPQPGPGPGGACPAPIPATPAGATRTAPDVQGAGPSWRARQAWAQSEARRRGLAHPEVTQ